MLNTANFNNNPVFNTQGQDSPTRSEGTELPMYKHVKRGLDVVCSGVGFVLTTPIFALTFAAIRMDSPGPVIFRQTRLGRDGRPFTMLKFRSMTVGAESGGVYEAVGDPRVTRVGRILRKTSLDELPQFINIFRGDMSLIGPRPTLEYHPWPLDQYTPEQRKRFLVRPGITGWAQVQGRKTVAWDQRLKFDAEYVENLSFRWDVMILFRTVAQVLSMAGNVNVSETAGPSKAAETTSEAEQSQ